MVNAKNLAIIQTKDTELDIKLLYILVYNSFANLFYVFSK